MAEQVLVADDDDKYDGKYVALRSLTDHEVAAWGDDPVEVMGTAKDQGIASPVVVFIPERDVTFIY